MSDRIIKKYLVCKSISTEPAGAYFGEPAKPGQPPSNYPSPGSPGVHIVFDSIDDVLSLKLGERYEIILGKV
jgi:hypothetical protein